MKWHIVWTNSGDNNGIIWNDPNWWDDLNECFRYLEKYVNNGWAGYIKLVKQ